MPRIRPHPLILTVLILVTGCSPRDDRLHQLATQSLARQAEQNQQMAKQTHEIAQATHELVEADAKACQDVIRLQTDLQTNVGQERASLDRQHEELEKERIQIAAQRQREPIIAAAIQDAAILLACLLPIFLCWFVVRSLNQEPPDAAIGELLVAELVSEQPLLLPNPPVIEHANPAIPHLADDQAA